MDRSEDRKKAKEFLRKFISDNKFMIDNKQIAECYELLYEIIYLQLAVEGSWTHYITSVFTETLIKTGIDPLKYLTYIPAEFLYKSNIESLTIPDHITEICDSAFIGCSKLKSVKFDTPSNVRIISYNAFAYCDSLEEIEIPESVIGIQRDIFWNSKNLKRVILHRNFNVAVPDNCMILYKEG